jgi:hypothetical protein
MIFRDQEYSPTQGTTIWELAPILAMLADPAVGFQYFDDFLTFIRDANANPADGVYAATGNAQIVMPVANVGGVIQVKTTAGDNSYCFHQYGALATTNPFVITDGSTKPLFFGCRVKAEQHADMGAFVGLAEEASAAAGFLVTDTMELVDKDFIGFRLIAATPTLWDFVYKKAGQVMQTLASVATNADDWHVFGFWYDGLHTVTPYADGVAKTVNLTSGATFPSAQYMAPILAIKTGEAVLKSMLVDYVRVIQAR